MNPEKRSSADAAKDEAKEETNSPLGNNINKDLLANENDQSMLPLQISHSPSPSTQPFPPTPPEGAANLNFNSFGVFSESTGS